jgi:sirohydrochlorin ferrochelatase
MRPARLISGGRLAVVLVAHGSRDPRAASATEALARAVRRAQPAWEVRTAYLDHAGPRPLDVLAALPPGRRAVVVPLLLTAAYHGRVDLPAVLEAAAALPVTVTLADVLGPRPPEAPARPGVRPSPPARPAAVPSRSVPSPLIEALVRRLPPVGLDAVVLSAAGTRDAVARSTVEWAAEALSARLRLPCTVAYASAAPPAPGAAVDRLRASGRPRVGMAAYFLAPGFLYDRAARSAREAGAVTVADPLGDAPELAALVAARVEAVARRPLAAA